MSLLERWTDSPLVAAMGWALVHSLWQCAIIAGALALALTGLRSAHRRYGVACAALLLMCVTVCSTVIVLIPAGGAEQSKTVQTAAAWINSPGSEASAADSPWVSRVLPWLAALWTIGVVAVYSYQTVAWISSRRLLRRGVCEPENVWQLRLQALSEKLGNSRAVLLLESALVETPVVLGFFKPVILVPAGLLVGLPCDQIEAILVHELAHVRRLDYAVNLLQRAVEGILFYHPAVWWTSSVVRRERENCCDDLAVGVVGDARAYACALAALEESRLGYSPALAATGGNLTMRIRRLLFPRRSGQSWTPLTTAALLVLTAAFALAWQTAREDPDSPTATPHLAWVNVDVAYLINSDERAAYLKLRTAEEREHFIEQFWLRRDPTPGTPENEFKTEHYRRIAYANKRFASGIPGWRTDRGHMYIAYGPPDEIESHPSGGRIAYPFEEWLYRRVEGVGDNLIFTFIDKDKTGDYRLAPRGR